MGNSRLVHPNANRDHSKYTLKHYDLAGKIVGKCLYESSQGGFYKQMVNARFSRSFLGQIIGFSTHYKYFEKDDPDLMMNKVKYLLQNDVTPMELTFTEDEYNSSTGQLVKVNIFNLLVFCVFFCLIIYSFIFSFPDCRTII
jgi:hypothetical protein